jgi:pSer/pThr/pTyr-binding forkhead associated (FHA) protein
MKISLVVAQGVHSGKIIPITTGQFLIGRDPHCNLRPASPAVSKQHCGIFQREDKVVVQDYGSTNGTLINGAQIVGEQQINNDDKLKIGPLEFVIRIEAGAPSSTVKAPAEVLSASAAGASTQTVVADAKAPAVSTEPPHIDHDEAAAMLLAMDDGAGTPTEEANIPDGTTVMDLPAAPGAEPKAPAKPAAPANSSQAAKDLLSKYMRRPRS